MNKFLSLVLALVMAMSLGTVAFAEEGVGTGTYSTAVTASTVDGVEGNGAVFSVDITWPNMNYTYHGEKGPIWDPDTYTYSDTVDAYWEESGTITVTSHSNRTIKADIRYSAKSEYSDATLHFSTKRLYLDAASNGNEAKSGTITVTPTGSLPNGTSDATIGSVSITISENKLDSLSTEELTNQYYDLISQLDANMTICSGQISALGLSCNAPWYEFETPSTREDYIANIIHKADQCMAKITCCLYGDLSDGYRGQISRMWPLVAQDGKENLL